MEDQNQPLDAGMASGESSPGLNITDSIKGEWNEIAKWAMFFAVLMFILLGIILIGTLFMIFAGGAVGVVLAIFMVGIYGTLLFFPAWYYYKFSTLTRQAMTYDDNGMLDEGFLYLKRFYRFIGILVVILLSLYALALLIGIAVGGSKMGAF